MITLRGILRTVPLLKRSITTSAPRHSGGVWTYRSPPAPPPKAVAFRAEFIGAFMWWWILYHLMTESEHITGEFPYPDPLKWTDAELGIPPDDED